MTWSRDDARLLRKVTDMIVAMDVYLKHFPRHEKYCLAARIRNTAYELFDLIVEAEKRYYKKTTLTSMDITHERLRMQWWMANELGYLAFGNSGHPGGRQAEKRYLTINRRIDEIGKMIGGWISAIKLREKS